MPQDQRPQASHEHLTVGDPDLITLYLVRHGETLFNERGIVQGWCDSPLTALGREQAAHMATELEHVPFDAAYSSISERAIDTAEIIIGERDLSVTYDRGLKELNFGIYEGLSNQDLWSQMPTDLDPKEAFEQMVGVNAPGLEGGESGREFTGRLTRAIENIRIQHPLGSQILVVSHGAAIGALLAALGTPIIGPLENASLTILTFDAEGNANVPLYGVTSIPENVTFNLELEPALGSQGATK